MGGGDLVLGFWEKRIFGKRVLRKSFKNCLGGGTCGAVGVA